MSSTKTKRYLMLLAAVGLVAAALGGTGTFASFNAETTNTGNYFATGSILLHNSANGGTECTSEANSSNTNNCTALFQVPLTGTASVKEATLALTNAGTLDSPQITFEAPAPACAQGSGVKATLATVITATTSVSSISITPLIGTIASGYSIVVSDGSNSQTFVASAAVSPGAVSIPVTTQTANFTFAAGTGTTVTGGPTFGGGGDLCSTLTISIIETNSNYDHTAGFPALGCAYGSLTPTIGCVAGSGGTLAALPSGTPSALNLASISTSTALTKGQTRYFVIQVIQPALGNAFQNRSAVFSLRWHIEA
jgi:predicted ribosomally synthesized peptide with SipW-like signal peptide